MIYAQKCSSKPRPKIFELYSSLRDAFIFKMSNKRLDSLNILQKVTDAHKVPFVTVDSPLFDILYQPLPLGLRFWYLVAPSFVNTVK